MKDRIPLYPGRVTLTPVSGQTNTYDMVRADQPTEAGMALNKANLLSDATAEALGLSGDATPDDALKRLARKAELEVGDIMFSARTNLNSNWLLCNGARIIQADYPELYALTSRSPDGDWAIETGFSYDTGGLIINGYLVIKDAGGGGYLAYRRLTDSSFTVKQIATQGNIQGVIWDGSRYVAIVTYNSKPILCYATTLDGTWTQIAISTSLYADGGRLIYANGYYVLLTAWNQMIYVLYSSTLSASGWTNARLDTTGNNYLNSIKWVNDRFEVIAYYKPGDYAIPQLYYSTNLSSWTIVASGLNLSSWGGAIYYDDNKYAICGVSPDNTSELYIADTWGTAWTPKTVFANNAAIGGLLYDGVYWYLTYANSRLAYTNDLDEGWTYRTSSDLMNITDGPYLGVKLYDSENEIVYVWAASGKILARYKALPTISVANAYAYAYIKALEESV